MMNGVNSNMNKLITHKMIRGGARVAGGGVNAPGIIQFPGDIDEIEKIDNTSKKSVSNEDLDEDLDLKHTIFHP